MLDLQFWLGVVNGLVATLIAWLIIQIKTGAVFSLKIFSLFWSITRRLKDAGVTNVFTNRSDYVNFREEKSIPDYIKTAKKELIYVGFWLAQGVEIDKIEKTFLELLNKGCTLELVFLNSQIDRILANKIAVYLGMSQDTLTARLEGTWSVMRQFKQSLADPVKGRFILRRHEEVLTSSAFIFDHGIESAKTLVDFKIYGAGRGESFGIEMKPCRLQNSLYNRLTTSFFEIRNKSVVDVP